MSYTASERGHCFNVYISRSDFLEQISSFITPPLPRADKYQVTLRVVCCVVLFNLMMVNISRELALETGKE